MDPYFATNSATNTYITKVLLKCIQYSAVDAATTICAQYKILAAHLYLGWAQRFAQLQHITVTLNIRTYMCACSAAALVHIIIVSCFLLQFDSINTYMHMDGVAMFEIPLLTLNAYQQSRERSSPAWWKGSQLVIKSNHPNNI